MFVSHPRTRPTRRGAILIVVLAMLALFAVLGLSFVLYADSQAGAARNNMIAENKESKPDPTLAAQQYLLVQMYDVTDLGDDLMNPLRGHSLARSKYGYNAAFPRLSPFVGQDIPPEPPGFTLPGVGPVDRRQVVRFTWDQANNFVVDPERFYGGTPVRSGAGAHSAPLVGTYVNKAVPSTYPDRNNFYLARMNPATGQIDTPSFHRDDLFGALAPSNPNWTNAVGKYLTLRPRPQDNPNFPYPPPNADGTYTGDVSNMRFITGSQKNDSVWVDVGGPVLEWQGRKYKALVAPLILDLNSRINLSVAGNVRTGDINPANVGMPLGTPNSYIDEHPRHTSLHGLGPWEVNPTAVFPNLPGAGLPGPAAWRGQNWELFALLRQRFPQPNPMPDATTAPPRVLLGATPQPDPMYQSPYGRVGHSVQPRYLAPPPGIPLLGQLAPPYSHLDLDGVTIQRPIATTTDPMIPPLAGGFGPFPTYPGTRFAADQDTYANSAQRLHPSMFNPFQWQRGGATTPTSSAHPFGNDDAMKWLTRFTDPKGRYTNTNLYRDTAATMAAGGWGVPTNLGSPFVHATTTLFSTSQQWAEVPVATGPGTFVNLGPVDVNRPLADYRRTAVWFNSAASPNRFEPVPHTPVNVWNPNVPSAAALPTRNEPALFALARQARQNLARDIFVRLFALTGLVDGTNIAYNPATGYFVFGGAGVGALPPATQNMLRLLAQFAANAVDYTDADDINTAFVWNPVNPNYAAQFNDGSGTPVQDPATGLPVIDPSADLLNYAPAEIANRVVYGTELPRLVINEAYCVLENTRNPPETFPSGRASQPMKRRYWVELHNPLPADAAAVLSDGGAARLQYEAAVTAFQNPANPSAAPVPATATYNPYRLEVAVVPGGGSVTPYSTFLAAGQVNAVADTAPVPGMTLQARINNYIQDVTAPAPATPTLPVAGDGKNVVLPANGAATDGGTKNVGYYVIGPRDQFPAGSVLNSLSLPDPAVGGIPTPAAPVNALTFDATGGAPTGTDVTTARSATSVVILRRLANPYLPPQENATLPGYNPYVTTDYIENLPSLDRVGHDSAGTRTPTAGDNARPTIGRKHPYVAFPTYGSAVPNPAAPPAFLDGVQDQVAAGGVSPPHTLFSANSPLDNVAAGLPWLVHLDRQLVNSLELLHVSTFSPALLTHKFYSERLDAANNPLAPRVFEYQRHTAWTPNAATPTEPLVPALRSPGWYKALDLLVCGNPMPGVPVGGREPGKINPNTIADPRLLNAVFDPQPGNAYAVGAYAANPTLNTAFVGAGGPVPVWTALNSPIPDADVARTPNGVPRATIAESGAITGDRPFRSFAGSPDLQDSLLRTNRQVSAPAVPGQPVLFNNTPGAHPHVQAEPLRKMLNSLTTTSDSFLVVMTVGFFEVTNAGPHSVTNQPVLGKELFDRVPGDLRAQFAAVVDRSQLAVHHDGQLPGETNTGAIQANVASKLLPVQMKLLRDTTVGANQIVIEAGPPNPALGVPHCMLYDNGIPLPLTAGRLLRLGNADVNTALVSGASTVVSGGGEWVRVASVAPLRGPDPTGAIPPGASPNPYDIPGHYVITLDPAYTMGGTWAAGVVNRYHSAGTKVTTVVMGNPGPQAGVTLEQLRQRGLVPYFSRIEP